MTGLSAFALLTIYALAVARVTRLIVADKIFDRPRGAVLDWLATNRHPMLLSLLDCPWCVSVWLGAAAAPLVYFAGRTAWLIIPATALAFSHITGWLSGHETQPQPPS